MLPLVLTLALAAPPEPPAFTVIGAGDASPTGKLTAISLTLGAQVDTPGGAKTVQKLVGLRKPDAALPPLPAGVQIITAAGDRVPGTVSGGDTKTLRFTHATSDEAWSIALDAVAVVWLKSPPADTPVDPAKYTWLTGTPTRDVLLYRNGDAVRGVLNGYTEAGVKFVPNGGTAKEVALKDLAAVGSNPRFVRPPKPKGPYACALC